jgi:lipopolysaccharide biosynthesis protein
MPRLYARLRERRHAARATRAGSTPSGPASLGPWLDRLPDHRRLALSEDWLPYAYRVDAPRVAVVVHVFFPDLLAQILDALASIPAPFDLIVTNASGTRLDVRCPPARRVRVLEVENHGRDIWPLLQVVNAGLLDPYEIVLKVHTKRSEWRQGHQLAGSGGDWRNGLLKDLVGSSEQVLAILGSFARDPRLGMVTSDDSVLGPEYWGGNELTTRELARRLELDVPEDQLRFAAGSMYWTRGFVLQGLRALNASRHDFEEEAGQVNATTAHAVERLLGVLVGEAGLRIAGVSSTAGRDVTGEPPYAGPVAPDVRIVPFYLPQFHPVPENDRWWGKGFTEWTNVTSARPVFLGHHQPKLPTTTGFYDLRLPESVALQNELARSAGIHGFMYYHYWFAGRSILERPLQDRLKSDDPTPFCIMWANENWTRRWDGRSENILLGQDYEHVDSSQFLQDVLPFLLDPRYLRVDDKPVLAVYRPRQIPDLLQTVTQWRRIAEDAGLADLLLLSVDVDQEFDGLSDDVRRYGFDGTLGFPPHRTTWPPQKPRPPDVDYRFHGNILSYEKTVDEQVAGLPRFQDADAYPGVMVTFDNTARRQWSSDIWYGSNPYTFHRWLAAAIAQVMPREPEHRLVFINAWNEWAEGAVLEPQDRVGSAYLLAVRNAIDAASRAVAQ